MTSALQHYNNLSLQQAINQMVATTVLEKVYLYGVSQRQIYAETIFVQAPITRQQGVAGYHFLVLTPDNDKRRLTELTDLLENAICKKRSSTVYALPVTEFNSWLLNGHPFACKIYCQAVCGYDAGMIPMVVPGPCNEEEVDRKLHSMLTHHLMLATEFMQGADLFKSRKKNPLAAFHLHQACEQLYSGIIQYVTGLRIGSHNLMKLYRHSGNLVAGLMDIFPMHQEKEKTLFQLLQAAYTGARYTDNYFVSHNELNDLWKRITQILTLCQRLSQSTSTIF
jgi:HEPN domain-containing protein